MGKKTSVFLFVILLFCFIAGGQGPEVQPVLHTANPTPIPLCTLPIATICVTPVPTWPPTPTPDPLDAVFAPEGQDIILYEADNIEIDPYAKGAPLPDHWLYNSHDLRIEINTIKNTELNLQYYIADIRFRSAQEMFSLFNNPDHPGTRSAKQYRFIKPAQLSRRDGVIFAQNGDYMTYSEKEMKGPIIRNGICYWEGAVGENVDDILAFLPDGSLKVYSPGQITVQQLLNMGIRNTIAFGPTLVIDGSVNRNMNNNRRINSGRNPRSGIGMVEPGHFISIVVEGRMSRSRGMSCEDFAELFISQGCCVAYNLDGGASAALVFMGNMCNQTIDDGEVFLGPRPMIDMLAFGVHPDVPEINGSYYNNGRLKESK